MKIKHKSIISFLLSAVLLLNSSSVLNTTVFADDDTEYSKTSIGRDKYADDRSWVYHKDNWRHGRTLYIPEDEEDSGSGSSSSSSSDADEGSSHGSRGNALGHAEGKCAIEYHDGMFYWFHQTDNADHALNDGCVYCGDWTAMNWGTNGIGQMFGLYACEVYSLAAITANLAGEEITPLELLEQMGSKYDASRRYCDTTDVVGHAFYSHGTPTVMGNNIAVLDWLVENYGFQYSENLAVLGTAEAKLKVDEILDKGGMIWFVWAFDTYGPNHYVAIRSHDSKGYYLIDSCNGPGATNFDRAWSFNELWGAHWFDPNNGSPWDIYGIWNPNPPSKKSSSSSDDEDEDDKDTSSKDSKSNKDNKSDKESNTSKKSKDLEKWSDHSSESVPKKGDANSRLNAAKLSSKKTNYEVVDTISSKVTNTTLSDSDKKILKDFMKNNASSGTNAEKVKKAADWLYSNVTYADGSGTRPAYATVAKKSAVEAALSKRAGQSKEYNGAMAAILNYMGYDAKLIVGHRGTSDSSKAKVYWVEVNIADTIYVIDVGNRTKNPGYKVMCLTYAEANKNSNTKYMKFGEVVK